MITHIIAALVALVAWNITASIVTSLAAGSARRRTVAVSTPSLRGGLMLTDGWLERVARKHDSDVDRRIIGRIAGVDSARDADERSWMSRFLRAFVDDGCTDSPYLRALAKALAALAVERCGNECRVLLASLPPGRTGGAVQLVAEFHRMPDGPRHAAAGSGTGTCCTVDGCTTCPPDRRSPAPSSHASGDTGMCVVPGCLTCPEHRRIPSG